MLVTIGVRLGRIVTAGDLESGIEPAERLVGYTVAGAAEASRPASEPDRREA